MDTLSDKEIEISKYLLNEDQLTVCSEMWAKNLTWYWKERNKFLDKIITGDETWFTTTPQPQGDQKVLPTKILKFY